jgi:hypothetical protein
MKKANTIPFDEYYIHAYATETLINGNTSECITYLKGLFEYGKVGMRAIRQELLSINYTVPDKYKYVMGQVFSS